MTPIFRKQLVKKEEMIFICAANLCRRFWKNGELEKFLYICRTKIYVTKTVDWAQLSCLRAICWHSRGSGGSNQASANFQLKLRKGATS